MEGIEGQGGFGDAPDIGDWTQLESAGKLVGLNAGKVAGA